MKGYTNSKGNLSNETVIISITGVDNPTFTVSYNGADNTYTGNNLLIAIPDGLEYTITFDTIPLYTAPQPITYTATKGNLRTINVEYIYNPAIDLSMFDIYGNPIALTTANCYVISKPGKYKFPMVYGNAIKNGQINASSYTNNGGTYSSDFKTGGDSSGKYDDPIIITLPFIDVDCPLHEYDRIYISIADTDNIISNLEVVSGKVCNEEHNYISFDVLEIPSTGANAIISYEHYVNRTYTIWNWHIWLWSYDLTPVEITNATGVTYNILPVNLATKLDTTDSINQTTGWKNWFYLWGRPTPLLCPSAYNSTTNHTSYGEYGYKISDCVTSISDGITNPTTFYKGNASYNYNWFKTDSGKTYNLWDAACTTTGDSDNNTVKTVYDPCPVGWKIPNGKTFTGFAHPVTYDPNIVRSDSNGLYLKRYPDDTVGVYFPFSSRRGGGNGNLLPSTYGYYWMSADDADGYAAALTIGDDYVSPGDGYVRSEGLSIRPVEDDITQMDMIMISFNIYNDGPYQAESGMTWLEWVNSEYNVDGWYIDSNTQIVNSDGTFCVLGPDNLVEKPTDVINGLSYKVESA